MKEAIVNLKSKAIDKKMRLKGEALSTPQQKIDQAARRFIKDNEDILSAKESNLKLLNIQKVRDKAYVTYQQYYNNIPVYQAIVKFVITKEGKIPSCGSDYHKDINMSTIPAMQESHVLDIAKNDAQFSNETDEVLMDGLFILPLNEGNVYAYHLAYKLAVSKDKPEPACWVYFIDANTGEILIKYNDIRHEAISGKVTGLMLPEYYDETPQNVPFKDEYVKITAPANQTTTGSNGNYSLTLTPGTYSLISSLEGPWAKVINAPGSSASYSKSISAPAAHNIDWNTSGEAIANTAEMNAFYHVNKIHDYVKNTLKYDGMDFQMPTTVNKKNYANAYYSSKPEIVFGDGGRDFPNFALLSDIIYHEYTHGTTHSIYDAPYYGESGAIDEGLADYFACTINDDSLAAEPLSFARNLDNTLKIPDDWVDEVHADGKIIGGAFWDLRKSLGNQLADELIHAARFSYPIDFSEYVFQIQIADDDNDTIFDGTPHMQQIKAAFSKHGIYMPCFCAFINEPKDQSYIRGMAYFTGIAATYNSSDFKKYELYCWKKNEFFANSDNGSLIVSSTTAGDGVLAIWDTTKYEDNEYYIGLRVVNQKDEGKWVYINCIVDNVDSPPLLEKEFKCGYVGEKLEFTVKGYDIDDPDGPYGNTALIYSAANLPAGAGFDSDDNLFSWIPQDADLNKTYCVRFTVSDGVLTSSEEIIIYVGRLIKIGASVPISEVSYKISIYEDKVVYENKGDIYLYDVVTGDITPIANDPLALESTPDIYGNIVAWKKIGGEFWSSVYIYDISKGKTKWLVGSDADYENDEGDFLQFWPDVYKNRVVWQEAPVSFPGNRINLYLYEISDMEDISNGVVTKIVCPEGICPKGISAISHAIYGDKIVWNDFFTPAYSIGMYDIPTKTCKWLTDINAERRDAVCPAIYGDKVVWINYIGWDIVKNIARATTISLYSISREKEMEIDNLGWVPIIPAISEGTIVWDGAPGIYAYSIPMNIKLKISDTGDHPAIYKNKIAWQKDGEIFLSILPEFYVDTTAPITPTVTDDGVYAPSWTQLHATWSSSDPESGITQYRFAIGTTKGANDVADWVTVESNVTSTTYDVGLSLTSGATYYFSVQAMNWAGLWSNIGYSDGIKTAAADTTPPAGTIKINDDAKFTNSIFVALNLSAADAESGMVAGAEMMFSNDGTDWSTAEAYAETKSWTLTSGDGEKTVYAKFKDAAGNWSDVVSDSIILDTTPPAAPVIIDDGDYTSNTTRLHASWSSSDPESGIVKYEYKITADSKDGDIIQNWTDAGITTSIIEADLSLQPGKTYYFSIKAINGAGAWSDLGYSDGIKVVAGTLEKEFKCGYVGEKLEFTVEGYDIDDPNEPCTYSAVNLPAGAVFNSNDNLFSWIPQDTDLNKTYYVRFTVSDGVLTSSKEIIIYVGKLIKIGASVPISENSYKISIYEDKVVYENKGDIYLYDVITGDITPIANDSLFTESTPDIYGNIVAWKKQKMGGPWSSVYIYDISKGTTKWLVVSKYYQDSHDFSQFWPDVYKNRVVWQEMQFPSVFNLNLYLYEISDMRDISSGVVTKITGPMWCVDSHAIYGDKIVWKEAFVSTQPIGMYDIPTKTYKWIADNNAGHRDVRYPAIYGDKVVWINYIGGDQGKNPVPITISLYSISSGKETEIANLGQVPTIPAIFEDIIVWGGV